MTKPPNPPAFPSDIANCEQNFKAGIHSGMTLRDYFANGCLMMVCNDYEEDAYSEMARQCYLRADAMLSERNKNAE